MTNGICAFCGQNSKLVESHVIPKGLYWGLQGCLHKAPILVSPFENEFQKDRPIGFYDYFLCHVHEKQFNDWDTYAIKLLRDTTPKTISGGWLFEGADYKLIKLFFISLLWRAHVTKNIFFERVSLGPHADRLKELIAHGDPSTPEEYSVILWRSEELLAKVIIAPYHEKYAGVSFIRFYLPGYMALIKVDNNPLSQEFKPNALGKSNTWFVALKKYVGESEERVMMDVAKKNLERKKSKKSTTPNNATAPDAGTRCGLSDKLDGGAGE